MGDFSRELLIKFLQTDAGTNALRLAGNIVSEEMISAAKYYMGVPNGKYFNSIDFDEEVVKAKKAYVTLNSILGGETSEIDRFREGRKQIPGLLTPLGVRKMIHLVTHLYCFASGGNAKISFETVRACRQSEISEGESIVNALTSTTKLSIDEIIKLGYGDKNGLALCRYKFHEGVVALDMEKLGKEYLKPEEREVLLLIGNRLSSHCIGYDNNYLGKDGKPALVYEIDVYSPEFGEITESLDELENIVYDEKIINEVNAFYSALNHGSKFPDIPENYLKWKEYFQKMVIHELKKLL